MIICPQCHNEYDIDQSSLVLNYCPNCGQRLTDQSIIINVDAPIFDICHQYTNCFVEVLENSITGECSIGWRRTEDTEEF